MAFRLDFSDEAKAQLAALEQNDPQKLKKVRRALGFLEANPRHPSLNTHPFTSLEGPLKEKVFEAYAENAIAGAYRIFWYYPKPPDTPATKAGGKPASAPKPSPTIVVFAITPHPK